MTDFPSSTSPPSSMSSLEDPRLEHLLNRFEGAWRQGTRPVLEEYLPKEPAERAAALRELIHLDLEYRLRTGEPARVEDYLRRYPHLNADLVTLQGLLTAEWQLRCPKEPGLPWSEYLRRFPQLGAAEGALQTDPTTARRVGKYHLLEVAGRGSLGVVHRAWDIELLRIVAVKVPRLGGMPSPEEAERFLREARSAAGLRHPHIVPVYDAGCTDDGCYLVSAFVPGTTLAERLRAGRLPLRPAIELLVKVAEAMQHAHTQGIIHRDLKPSNILLDDAGQPFVTDFGLAKGTDGNAPLTRDGEVLGTPAYMAPEQARGEANKADARSDVYSMGVILYELLTGRPPFQGDERTLLRQVLDEEPLPPRHLNAAVPRDLETVCLKALAKEPGRRYPSAAAFADELRRFLTGQPVLARPVGRVGHAWRWCQRKPVLAGLLAMLALVTAFGASTFTWQWLRADEFGRRAEAHRAAADRQEQRAEALRVESDRQRANALAKFYDFHQTLCKLLDVRVDPAVRGPDLKPVSLAIQDEALAFYQKFLRQWGNDSSLLEECALAHYVVGVYLRHRSPQEAQSAFQASMALYEELARNQPSRLDHRYMVAEALVGLGSLHRTAGRTANALAAFLQSCNLREALHREAPHAPEHWLSALADLWLSVADLHSQSGQYYAGLEACRQGLALTTELRRQQPNRTTLQATHAGLAYTLGTLYRRTGHRVAALAAYQEAVDLIEPLVLGRPDDLSLYFSLARGYYFLGYLHGEQGRPTEACAYLEKAIPLHHDLCRRYPDNLEFRGNLGEAWHKLGVTFARLARQDAAAEAFQEAVTQQRWTFARGPGEPRYRRLLADHWLHLARALEKEGRAAEADVALSEHWRLK